MSVSKIKQIENKIKKLIRDLNLDISFAEVKRMIWEEETKVNTKLKLRHFHSWGGKNEVSSSLDFILKKEA